MAGFRYKKLGYTIIKSTGKIKNTRKRQCKATFTKKSYIMHWHHLFSVVNRFILQTASIRSIVV